MNKIIEEKVRHLIVKYGNQLSHGHDTIDEHLRILKRERNVWFGKMGSTIGINTFSALEKQIAKGETTYVFLFQGSKSNFLYRGKVIGLSRVKPGNEDSAIPAYYAKCGLDRQMKLWIKLSKLVRVELAVLANYHTVSSGKKALHSASKSMASVFVIAEGASKLDM